MSPLHETWGENEAETAAEDVINDVVKTGNSKEEIFAELEKKREEAEGQKKENIGRYITGVRDPLKNMLVKKLDAGTGGLYDGTNTIMAKGALEISGSIEQTIAQAKEISRHEGYHADNNHLEAMKSVASVNGGAAVTIGKKAMESDKFIEGLTVARTGEEFVSPEYRKYKSDLLAGIRRAGISLEDVEEAVAKKDLTLIDDATREKKEKNRGDLVATSN